jgi:hypothetical protein
MNGAGQSDNFAADAPKIVAPTIVNPIPKATIFFIACIAFI